MKSANTEKGEYILIFVKPMQLLCLSLTFDNPVSCSPSAGSGAALTGSLQDPRSQTQSQ